MKDSYSFFQKSFKCNNHFQIRSRCNIVLSFQLFKEFLRPLICAFMEVLNH